MPELSWESLDTEIELRRALIDGRLTTLTLASETETGAAEVEQSATLAAHPLVSQTDMSAAAIAQSATLAAHPLVSTSAMTGNALIEQATTIAALNELVAQTHTGQVGARWILDDFRVQKTPQQTGDGTAVLAWDSPNKGPFG